MQSKATTVQAYLASLPPDRREAIEAVRKVILKNLDKDYVENMSYGMIGYCVPHSIYPPGYHCKPEQALPFAALASQKNYMSVYLMCTYGRVSHLKWFQDAWAKTGKKLDMGKSCIRFKKVEDLALDVIGESIRRVPAKNYIAEVEAGLAKSKVAKPTRKPATKKASTKKPAAKKSVSRAGKSK
jgi:uncharacterized protein YdhG (YjbR/CyaY superfamily)